MRDAGDDFAAATGHANAPSSAVRFVPRWLLWVLITAFSLTWFGTLESRKLIKTDEGRYAEIAREMAASGDWVTPRLNGLKYFYKPPLQYWMSAAAFKAFGEHEWSARLWTGLTGFAGILLAFFVARRLWDADTGLLGAAVLGSSFGYVVLGHLNSLDMGLTFFMHLALSGFLLANRPGTDAAAARRWMLVTWAALALAVLSKGPVALVIAGGSLVLYSVLTRDIGPWRRLEWLRGLGLFLLIGAPWFIAVSWRNPEFAHFFFVHEHFERFLTTVHRRYQPWWYFGPVFIASALPWTLLALHSLVAGWRTCGAAAFQSERFLVVWIVFIFVFFSASSSKLPSYILPALPASALLVGAMLPRLQPRALMLHLALVTLLAAGALALAPRISDRADHETPSAMMNAFENWAIAAACMWLLGTASALALTRRARVKAAALCLAVAGFAAQSAALQGHGELARSNSAYYLAEQIRPLLSPGVPFYSVAMYEQTLTYYLRRTVTLVNYTDEMELGLRQEPDKGIPSEAEFERRWLGHDDAFAVMTAEKHAELRERGLPMHIVAEDTRRLVVSRR